MVVTPAFRALQTLAVEFSEPIMWSPIWTATGTSFGRIFHSSGLRYTWPEPEITRSRYFSGTPMLPSRHTPKRLSS